MVELKIFQYNIEIGIVGNSLMHYKIFIGRIGENVENVIRRYHKYINGYSIPPFWFFVLWWLILWI